MQDLSPAAAGGETAGAGARTFLTFCLADQALALDVAQVREILDLQPVARVPNADRDVLGVIDVRGEGVAMVDLANQIGMLGSGSDARIIVLDLPRAEGRRAVGFKAERVIDVVEVLPEAIKALPVATAGRWGGATVTGMTRLGGALFMIVDLEALLGAEETSQSGCTWPSPCPRSTTTSRGGSR